MAQLKKSFIASEIEYQITYKICNIITILQD